MTGLWGEMANTGGLGGSKYPHGCRSGPQSGHIHRTSFSSEVLMTGLWVEMANTGGLGGSKCSHGCRSGPPKRSHPQDFVFK